MRFLSVLLPVVFLLACNSNHKAPDVSDVKINVSTQRFEEDLFKLDTNNLAPQLDQLQARYPSFGENFFASILNCDPQWSADTMANYVKGFIGAYRKMYDTSEILFHNFEAYEKEIKKGLQYLVHYFPAYKAPAKIITYIGPVDGYGDILTDDAIVVGLQHHLGKQYSLYRSPIVQETYPDYISSRFEPGYIAVNAMKNIVLDMFPEKMEERPLVQQMVEKGKRLYVLARLLPGTDEYKLIGYSKEQLASAYKNEKTVWNLFVQNNFLQTIDNNIIKNYIGEGPKTQELGEGSPGNIGSFAGWQIVKKYMDKHPDLPLPKLMATDPEVIFTEARYKP